MNRSAPDGDGNYHSIYGVDDLRYTSTRFLNLEAGIWQHQSSPLMTIGFSGGHVRLQTLEVDGSIELRSGGMPGTLSIENYSKTGSPTSQNGRLHIRLGETAKYIQLFDNP